MIHRDEILQLWCTKGQDGRGTALKDFFFFKSSLYFAPPPLGFQPSPHRVAQNDSQQEFRAQPSSVACSHGALEPVKGRAGGIRPLWPLALQG